MSLRTSALAVASTLAMLATLSSCAGGDGEGGAKEAGFADQSAIEIQSQVASDMTKLQSVRMAGEIDKDGDTIGIGRDVALAAIVRRGNAGNRDRSALA